MSFKGILLSCLFFLTTISVQAVAWKPITVNPGLVKDGQIEITGFLNGRNTPNAPGEVPEFRGTKSLYKVIPPGTKAKVLEVKKNIYNGRTEYAVKVKLTTIGTPNVGDYQPENYPRSDQEMWVYVDPVRPYVKYLAGNEDHPFKDFAENKISLSALAAPTINLVESAAGNNNISEILPSSEPADSALSAPLIMVPSSPAPAAAVTPSASTAPVVNTVTPLTTTPSIPVASISNNKMCKVPVTPEDKTSANCEPSYCANRNSGYFRDQKMKNIVSILGQAKANHILSIVEQAAKESGVNPAILMAKMDEESSFNRNAISKDNDQGIAQFQFDTGKATLKYWKEVASGSSPVKNLTSQNLSANRGRTSCGSVATGLVPDLYCPEFAIRLMAFHVKQTLAQVPKSPISTMLVGDDPVAQMRYISSVYNRGNRIIKSGAAYKERTGKDITARNYGVLWNTSGTRQNPGVLKGQFINRCYVYRIAGLCGGLGNSIIGQYTALYCNSSNSTYKIPSAGVQ